MPYDGNGNYTLPPVYKATPGTEIITTQHNTPLEDIQAALNAVLLRNGSAPITGNWNMGTNRITFLADGVANADAANVGQLKALLNNTALTGVTTVPPVTDWTAYQPVGAKDADARYARLTGGNTFTGAQNITGVLNVTGTITALVASSTQKITFRRASTYGGINSYDGSSWHPLMINDDDTASTAKGTLAFSDVAQTFTKTQTFSGQTLVQDVDTFDGKDALNAETAERRYVRSVPNAGGTNVRIVDVQEDAAGNLIATKSDGTTTSYAPGSYGTFTGGYWIQTGNIRQIWWSQKIHSGDTVPFPFAFASAPEVFATQTEYQDQLPQFAMGFACINDAQTTATSCVIRSLVIQDTSGSFFPAPSGGVVVKFYAVGPVS